MCSIYDNLRKGLGNVSKDRCIFIFLTLLSIFAGGYCCNAGENDGGVDPGGAGLRVTGVRLWVCAERSHQGWGWKCRVRVTTQPPVQSTHRTALFTSQES